MNIKKKIFLVLIVSLFPLFSESFTTFFNSNSFKIYQDTEIKQSSYSENSLEKYRIINLYSEIFDLHLNKPLDKEKLIKKIYDLIEDLEDGKINNITEYETDLITSILYGSVAYIMSPEPSFSLMRKISKAENVFSDLEQKYNTPDVEFGGGLSKLAKAIYFEDSFWSNRFIGGKGSVHEGLKILANVAFKGDLTKIEANLFLIEYYSDILKDHRSSLRFSNNLQNNFTGSKYFKYLYAVDLYHTGKINEAYINFRLVNSNITNTYFPFEYNSLIYEIKCLYLLGKDEFAGEVLKYSKKIHEGVLVKELDKWKRTLKRRKDIIYRFEQLNFRDTEDITKNDSDKKITANILFDHGYHKEIVNLIKFNDPDPDLLLLLFRAELNLRNYQDAFRIYEFLSNEHEDFLDDHKDTGRINILKNILDNILEN